MCRSSAECDGGRRCPEDSERRRARQRAAYAARQATTAATTPTNSDLDALPEPGEPPTAGEVAERIAHARNAIQQADAMVTRGDHGWSRPTNSGLAAERDVRNAGQVLAARAEHLAQPDLDRVRQRWADDGVTDEASYRDYLQRQLADAQVRQSVALDGLEAGQAIPPPQLRAYRAAERDITRIEREQALAAKGDSQFGAELHRARGRGYRAALAEQRSMGPGDSIEVHPQSDANAVKSLVGAVQFYPSEWVDQGTRARSLHVLGTRDRSEYASRVTFDYWRESSEMQERLVADVPDDGEVMDERVPAIDLGSSFFEVKDEEYARSNGQEVVYATKVRVPVAVKSLEVEEVSRMKVRRKRERVGCLGRGESAALHEYGHHMMHTLGEHAQGLEQVFVARRTTENGQRTPLTGYYKQADNQAPASSQDLTQTRSALRTQKERTEYEWVRADGFVDPYVGKEYGYESHAEVFTMGVEGIFAGKRGGLIGEQGFKADLEHRDLVLGMLAVL